MNKRGIVFTASTTFFFFSLQCWGFTLMGSRSELEGWDRTLLGFEHSTRYCEDDEQRVIDSLNKAVDLWNQVATAGLRLENGGETLTTVQQTNAIADGARTGMTDRPVIVCDPNFSVTSGSDASSVGGVGSAVTVNNQIVYGFIWLNAEKGKGASIENLEDSTLEILVAHEMGHVLGLGHSSEKKALMYFSASDKSSLFLSQDDVDGLTYLYPREEIGNNAILGCGALTAGGGGAAKLGSSQPSMLGNPPKGAMELLFWFIVVAFFTLSMGNAFSRRMT